LLTEEAFLGMFFDVNGCWKHFRLCPERSSDGHLREVIGRQLRRRFSTWREGRACTNGLKRGWVAEAVSAVEVAQCPLVGPSVGVGEIGLGELLAVCRRMGTKVFGSEKPKKVTGACVAETSDGHNGLADGAKP